MRAFVAAATTGILVGSAIAVTRFAIGDIGPVSLAFLRYLIGTILLLPFALTITRTHFARKDLLPMSILGIGQFGVLIVLLNMGLETVPSGLGALLFAAFPFMTMLLARLLGQEALTLTKAAGVILSIMGVGIAVALNDTTTGPPDPFGVALILGSALTGALCSIYYRPYVAKYPPLSVVTLAMAASVLFLIGPAIPEGLFTDVQTLSPPAWIAILFIALSSALAYYCWLYALKHLSPTKVTVFLSLSPIAGTLVGALLLGEAITIPVIIGCICVAAGLWLTSRG